MTVWPHRCVAPLVRFLLWLGASVATGFFVCSFAGCGSAGTELAQVVAHVAISPAELTFASTEQGAVTPAQSVTLTNTGQGALLISSVSTGDTADFSMSSGCGAVLAAGASCAIAVAFQPQAAGGFASTLTVTDNDGGVAGAKQTISLQGAGMALPVAQALLTPAGGVFPATTVGVQSASQTFTLRNTGTATLGISSVGLSDANDFKLANGCGSSLAVGASCGLTVTFQPQNAGTFAASLTVTDDSGGRVGAQQTVSVSGTGSPPPAPDAVLTPASLVFGQTMVTTRSAPQNVTLSNTGDAPLTISGSVLGDPEDFSMTSTCGTVVQAGASCAFAVTFQPQEAGASQTTLTVTDNSGTASGSVQQLVTVTGAGIPFAGPRATITPASLVFPKTLIHSSAAAQSVTLTNTGTTPLTISGVALNGANAGAFQVTGGTCAGALAAGAQCTESVVYSPTLTSSGDTAALVFTDDALGQSGATQTIPVSGAVLAKVDTVTNFGDSLTCGLYAEPHDGTGLVWSLEGYAGLFDTWLGVPAQDVCRQGDTAADMSRVWVPFNSTPTSTGNQLYTMMIGTNDAYRYGIPQSALTTYTQEVAAAVAWLAIPNADKVLGNTITAQSGTWSADVGFGVMSSDAQASLTFPVNQALAGRDLFVVYHVWGVPYGQAGKATIAVDGVVQATVEESWNSAVYLPTENGTTDTYLVQIVPLGPVGPHTVTFSSTGPAGSKVGLLWAGVPQQDYRTVEGAPRVLLGLIANSASGNQTYAADIYNLQLKAMVPALAADGLNVTIVPTDRAMDPGMDFADILHPNNSGHAKLAKVFEAYR